MESQFELKHLNVDELTIIELQAAMDKGELCSRDLVIYFINRIARYDQDGPRINSVMEINPDAIFIAEAMDLERKTTGARGPLHGIPVLLKDNIETRDKMRTSAGALVLANHVSSKDAFLVTKLREAGAVILGKANLTEWANGISSKMWAGYSARGGQVVNPYGDFSPGGSSSGSAAAVAANFTSVTVGTETTGSILSPSIQNSIVGIKPTVGLISRAGVIPFSYSQDTAGPMARTVTDAAILLGVLSGKDEDDPATWRNPNPTTNYTTYLDPNGLKNANIGVFREAPLSFYNSPEECNHILFENAVSQLKEAGANIIDHVEIPSFNREWEWNKLNYEFKLSVDHYLQSLPSHLPVHSIRELLEWNKVHEEIALKYGQDQLEYREQLDPSILSSKYMLEIITDLYHSQQNGIDYALQTFGLDAILFPSDVGSDLSARAGYPTIAVPAGYMENGQPYGITFAGTAFSEPTLIRIAYAFEQLTGCRKQPNLS